MDVVNISSPANYVQLWLASAAVLSAFAAWAGIAIQAWNMNRQLAASRSALREQIEASAEVARSQIEASTANALRQARANVISASRQRWIDALRDDLARFLSLEEAAALERVKTGFYSKSNNEDLLLVVRRIQLRLNPNEDLHNELVAAMVEALKGDVSGRGDTSKVLAIAQELLKSEWERIKVEASGA